MLHGIINEQGIVLMSEMIYFRKILFSHMFSNKSLASGALILAIIDSVDNKPMGLCYRC